MAQLKFERRVFGSEIEKGEGLLRVVQRRPRFDSERRQHLIQPTVKRPTSARRRIADLPGGAPVGSGRPIADLAGLVLCGNLISPRRVQGTQHHATADLQDVRLRTLAFFLRLMSVFWD